MTVLRKFFIFHLTFISLICSIAFSIVSPDNYINCGGSVSAICTDGSIVAFEQSGWIKYTDLSQPSPQTITIAAGQYPDISGDMIVWEYKLDGFYQIFAHDVSTAATIQITSGDFDHREPSISGSRVVYRYKDVDTFWHIAMATINGGEVVSTEPICTEAGNQHTPSIDGDIVAWQHRRQTDDERDIYYFNIAESQRIEVCLAAGAQMYPKTSGDIIVWQDYRAGLNDSDIYAYSIAQDAVYPICVKPDHQRPVSCSGELMVWMDMAAGDEGMYLFDFATYSIRRLAAQAASGWLVDISDNMVIWYDGVKINVVNMPLVHQLAITSPAAGQSLTGGRQTTIEWTNPNLQRSVNLIYSPDGGSTWQPIASLLTGVTTLQWTPPSQPASQSIIRICYNNEQDNLAGSGIFNVVNCDPALTADLSGDCYVGVEDLAILAGQWMQSGI